MRLCPPCPGPRASILLLPGHSPGDNGNHPVCCHCLRYQRVSAPPPGVNWSQLSPASHVWHCHEWCHAEECRQIQESVTNMQIWLQMSRHPGICNLHNPGDHQSLSSIIKIVSHKQEMCYWSEQESWACHWMTRQAFVCLTTSTET